MDNVLVITTLLLSCYLILCFIKPSGVIEIVLISFYVLTGIIVVWGYILSELNCLGLMSSWLNLGLITFVAFCLLAFLNKTKFIVLKSPLSYWLSINSWCKKTFGNNSIDLSVLLFGLAVSVFLIGILNLIIVIAVAPHNWDSMTYHLPRMAFYIQQNNLAFFDAGYWAQVVQPKNSTLLLIFTFLVFGHNENLTQLVQYISYWLAVASVYGITRKTGFSRSQSVFTALVSALLVEGIMQATTTQNDLLITAYFGSITFFLFSFREKRNIKYLYLVAIGIGLVIGTKASSLTTMPSVALLSLVLTRDQNAPKIWLKNLLILSGAVLLSICVFAAPSGYIDNYRHFGNPIGNQDVEEIHSFSGKPISYILHGGTYNILRYGLDSLSFDGLPPLKVVTKAQSYLRLLPRQLLTLVNINLETLEATSFSPFKYDRLPYAHDEHSYWGILGFGLLWVAVIISLFRFDKNPDSFLLSLAAVVFLIGQAYSGPYDASRGGRYFSIAAMFVSPVAGVCLTINNRAFRMYLVAVVLVGCVSGISAGVLKTTRFSATYPEKLPTVSIFSMNRIQQLTLNNPKYYQPLRMFEFIVPSEAKVAVFLYPNTFEYPLYGKNLSRVIVPINSFYRGIQPIPADAQYLLYAKGYPCALPNDKYLGADWFLRKLSKGNRECFLISAP